MIDEATVLWEKYYTHVIRNWLLMHAQLFRTFFREKACTKNRLIRFIFFSNQTILITWGRTRIGKFSITNNIVDLLQNKEQMLCVAVCPEPKFLLKFCNMHITIIFNLPVWKFKTNHWKYHNRNRDIVCVRNGWIWDCINSSVCIYSCTCLRMYNFFPTNCQPRPQEDNGSNQRIDLFFVRALSRKKTSWKSCA